MEHTTAIAVLCIVVAGITAQWFAWRLRLPAIVLLFAVGLIVGPGLQILRPAYRGRQCVDDGHGGGATSGWGAGPPGG